ncbi:hypothetical protein [Pusillimonas noertemannii]|uniref:hypothetical protein n=1 Tax=Pusillimonas noertemannii TaxID=305977 RepID=UPI0033411E3D
MGKGQNWTIIKESGRTEYIPDSDYYSIISSVGRDFMSAGGNWDRPNMLLLNGKIVVAAGLADVGYKYAKRDRELHDEISRKIREEFKPEWMSDGGKA